MKNGCKILSTTSSLLLMVAFFIIAPLSGKPPAVSYQKPVDVELPSRLRDWKYIAIHHSGSSVGNEAMIQQEHLYRGMENGMAYHFLIGNGSAGLGDGHVIVGRRWKYQLQGGHAHQDYLNENGIGICLVGNFNRTAPTHRQLQSLCTLILQLKEQFHITHDGIHGHGQFYGEDSDCPGKNFDWKLLDEVMEEVANHWSEKTEEVVSLEIELRK